MSGRYIDQPDKGDVADIHAPTLVTVQDGRQLAEPSALAVMPCKPQFAILHGRGTSELENAMRSERETGKPTSIRLSNGSWRHRSAALVCVMTHATSAVQRLSHQKRF